MSEYSVAITELLERGVRTIGVSSRSVPGGRRRIIRLGDVVPLVWRSGNAPGGDAANAAFIGRFRERVRWL